MHCSLRLVVQTLVFSSSYLHRQVSPPETLVVKGGTTWARNGRLLCLKMPEFHLTFRDLLYAVDLRHGTNGFNSLQKEGVQRIFSPWKIRRLRQVLNPRTWIPKTSTLPVDHRSRLNHVHGSGKFLSPKHCPYLPFTKHSWQYRKIVTLISVAGWKFSALFR